MIAVGALVAVLSACGQGSGSQPTETASQLVADARASLHNLKSFEIKGGFALSGSYGYLSAKVLKNGDASGSLSFAADDAGFVRAGGTTYLDKFNSFVSGPLNPDIAAIAARLKGQHWWKILAATAVTSSLQLAESSTVDQDFLSGRQQFSETMQKDSGGRAAYKLTDSAGSLFISRDSPHRLLEVVTALHYQTTEGWSAVDINLSAFDTPISVTAPASAVSADLASLPLYLTVKSTDIKGNCDSSGCPLVAVVEAVVGQGKGMVAFTVSAKAATLAKCTATVTVATSGTATATCFASGAAWTNWWNNSGGTYGFVAMPVNSDYSAPS
jgi:hypothetical protein